MNFKFDRISLEHGLSQSVVYQIHQDSEGFIWFGTEDGLNKYDGYNFKVYLNDPNLSESIIDSQIQTIFEDSTGNLWIGTSEGSLSKYNRDKDNFTNFTFRHPDKKKKKTAAITSITECENKCLIIGTYGNGLIKFDMRNYDHEFINQKRSSDDKEMDLVSCMVKDKDKIIFGTWGNGLGMYDLKKKKMLRHKFESESLKSAGKNIIRAIYRKADGNFLIGTNCGIHEINISENKLRELDSIQKADKDLASLTVTCICEDKNDNLWIGTRYNGIYFIDKKNKTCRPLTNREQDNKSLSSDMVICLFNDRSNVTWAGTIGEGVCKHDGETKKFMHVPELRDSDKSAASKNIVSFAEDDENNLWIGSFGTGLFRYDRSTGGMTNFNYKAEEKDSLGGISVMSLIFDKKNLWAGTLNGTLNRFNSSLQNFERYNFSDSSEDHIFAMASDENDPNKNLLIGTNNKGIVKFDKEKKEFMPIESFSGESLNSEFIKCMYNDSKNELWIGTNSGDGLFRRFRNNKKTINYKFISGKKDSISDNNILVIREDNRGDMWIGTFGRGLNKFERKTDKFKTYTTDDGLSNNSIRGILDDDQGNLWISTNKGICRFDLESEKFTNYDPSDGLQSNEFNEGAFYKAKDGTMYFGGINGFNYFRPQEIKYNPYIPNVVITDFKIFNRTVENSDDNTFLKKNITATKEINLSYRESVFSFEFAALIFNNSLKNQYAYMMEGFDKEWIYSGNRRFATYTNLEPGDYKFRVKASNNDGVWNEEGTSVKISISPPYWKTWWFKSLGVLSIMGATGMAYSRKLSIIEREKKSQEEFSRRLLDSQEQERKNIATELHHTIAHDVLITKNKAVMGLRNADKPDEVRSVLNEISDLAMNTLNDVRSISYNLHPHQIERLGITKAIKSIVNKTSDSSDIEFVADVEDIDNTLSKELEINVFRIIQECMSNILKHSGAQRSELKIIRIDNSIMIVISDNGKGLSQVRSEGLGIRGISERVRLYKGTFNIESVKDKGTIIHILLPIK